MLFKMLVFFMVMLVGNCTFTSSSVQILSEPTNQIRTVDITGNNELLMIGGVDTTPYVYVNTGTQFVYGYALPDCCTSTVDVMDVTADGEWLYVIDNYRYSYVYQYDYATNRYKTVQSLMITANTNQGGALTDDHQWLVYAKDSGWIYIYTFNGT